MTTYRNPNLIDHLKKLADIAQPGEQLYVYLNDHAYSDVHSELAALLCEDGKRYRVVYASGSISTINFYVENMLPKESLRGLTDEELEKIGFRVEGRPVAGEVYYITAKGCPNFNFLGKARHRVTSVHGSTFSVEGDLCGGIWNIASWDFELIEDDAEKFIHEIPYQDLESGKSYRIAPRSGNGSHPEGVFVIRGLWGDKSSFDTNQGSAWYTPFYQFFSDEKPVQDEDEDGLVEVDAKDLVDGETYVIKRRYQAVLEYGAACLHPEGEFKVYIRSEKPDNFGSGAHNAGNGWLRKLYRFFKVEKPVDKPVDKPVEIEVKPNFLQAGKTYRIQSVSWGGHPEGEYEIEDLVLEDGDDDTEYEFSTSEGEGWCASLYKFFEKVDVPDAVVDPEPEEETFTQDQVDEYVALKVAEAVEQERKNLYGVLQALGVNTDDLDTVIAAAKAARLAYWAAIGEPRKSEPKEISLKGWVSAVTVGSKSAEVDKEC